MFRYSCKDIYSINGGRPFSWISGCQSVLSALSFIETLSLCSALTTSSVIIVPSGISDKDLSLKGKTKKPTKGHLDKCKETELSWELEQ